MSNIFDLSEEDAPKTYDNISVMHPTFAWMQVLNPEQKRAVETTEGALLVLSGAGTGKTRVLTYRIAFLLSEMHVEPWKILAITFTNKVANEMKERVIKLVPSASKHLTIKTFHSFAALFLRKWFRPVFLLGFLQKT